MKFAPILAFSLCMAWATGCADQAQPRASSRQGLRETSDGQETLAFSFRRMASRVLPWNGSEATRFEPAGFEQVARGPSSLCLDFEGRPLVLNSLSKTLTRMDGTLRIREVLATAQPDFEDVTCSSEGFVLFSPLRSLVRVLGHDGSVERDMAVPRAIRRPVSLNILDGDLWLTTALQERWQVTRAREPLPLPALQRTKQEGFLLPDGKALLVQVRHGTPELLVLRPGKQGRVSDRIVRRLRPALRIDSLRSLWAGDGLACFLAEQRSQDRGGTIRVARSVECVNLHTGSLAASLKLPPPGIYAPRRWLDMRDRRLVVMVPGPRGLHLDLWKLEVVR